jgi:hypothetical protein
MNQFLWGTLAALTAVASIFFWKFWKRTADVLFFAFFAGFGVLALHWAALGVLSPTSETRHFFYVPRFVAFALILWGVIRKNRTAPTPRH